MELVPLHFKKIMQTRSYTLIILGNEDKQIPIYTDPSVGRILQLHLTKTQPPRPFTHDLISSLLISANMQVKQVVINAMDHQIYFSRLFLESEDSEGRHIIELDSRPSDALTLALTSNAPVYCYKDLLEQAPSISGDLI